MWMFGPNIENVGICVQKLKKDEGLQRRGYNFRMPLFGVGKCLHKLYLTRFYSTVLLKATVLAYTVKIFLKSNDLLVNVIKGVQVSRLAS